MNKRDKNSRYIQNRERTSKAQYNTLDAAGRMNQKQLEKLIARRRRIFGITSFIIILLSVVFLYLFYNWEDVVALKDSFDEQVINTPTPIPTQIPAPTVKATPTPTPVPDVTPAPVVTSTPKPAVVEFTISVVGDLSFYQSQLADAYNSDGTYDFSHNFEAVKPYLDASNYVIANFNSVCIGDRAAYSGDPNNLNTPESVFEDIKEAGIDALVTANENFFSQGWIGVQYTNNYIQKAGLVSTGTYLSEVEYYKPLIVEVEGIKIGILNYANKRAVVEIEQLITEKQASYGIKVLKMSNVSRDVELCQDSGADLIFAYVNWGNKTSLSPTSDIASYASAMTEAGVDCIFGAYPEVIQPIVAKALKRGKDDPSTGVIAYSLGSFITSRRTQYLDCAAILNITYRYDTVNETLNMGEITYVPTYISVQNDGGDTGDYDYRIIPVWDYLNDGELYNTLTDDGKERISNVWSDIVGLLGEGLIYPLKGLEETS